MNKIFLTGLYVCLLPLFVHADTSCDSIAKEWSECQSAPCHAIAKRYVQKLNRDGGIIYTCRSVSSGIFGLGHKNVCFVGAKNCYNLMNCPASKEYRC